MRVLFVAIDAGTAVVIEQNARLAGDAEFVSAYSAHAVAIAREGECPAAALIAEAGVEPIGLARSLASIDPDMAITILCTPERQQEVRNALRFAPLITPYTRCRSTADIEQVGVDLVQEGQAALRRREYRSSVAAAVTRLGEPDIPRLRGEALGRLVDGAPIAIMTLDARGTVAAWNAYAVEMIGAAEQDVLGRPVYELFDEHEHERITALLEAVQHSGPRREPVLLCRCPGGDEQFLEVLAGPTFSQTGDPATVLVLSDVTGRVLAERARRRAEDAQAFLAETGALLDTSLDTDETLQRIASLAVPRHAELCLIDLLGPDGTIQPKAIAASEAGVAETVRDVRNRYPLDPAGEHPVARVLRSGRAEMHQVMGEALYGRIAGSGEHRKLMRRLGYRSALVAPLVARGRTYGVMSLLHLGPEGEYSQHDLRVLEDVARRAAQALDNARLYSRERSIAETLQRSLLPSRLPDIDAVSLASHYQPGQGDVGGDWYDVISLPEGRLGCVVGDVVGRGVKAASVMGQLRNAVRVYALERQSADEVVNAVDRLAASAGIEEMATLVYAIVDSRRGCVEFSCAGHPPPLLAAPDGAARYLMDARSCPVGIGGAGEHTAATHPFPPGAVLLLYTDGLVERRNTPLDTGLAKLKAATSAALAAESHPARVAEQLVAELAPDPGVDDVALLVICSQAVGHQPPPAAASGF
ncbi:MAG: SpoIIE family protein phosphatase [Solirubrobacteraceae bacterium]